MTFNRFKPGDVILVGPRRGWLARLAWWFLRVVLKRSDPRRYRVVAVVDDNMLTIDRPVN